MDERVEQLMALHKRELAERVAYLEQFEPEEPVEPAPEAPAE
jgi:hypothetical protein